MSQSTAIRASTQDNSTGTQVAQAVNEVTGAGALQTVCIEGNKSTYNDIVRTGLTAADTATDLSTVGFAGTAGANLLDLGNALSVTVRGTCDTANKTLVAQIIFYDAALTPLSKSEQVSFNSDAILRQSAAGYYISQRAIIDAGQARYARVYVVSMTGTTWNVYARPI